MMSSVYSCADLPSLSSLGNTHLSLLHIFYWVVFLLLTFKGCYIYSIFYSDYESFFRYIFANFSPSLWLSFRCLNGVFWRADTYTFNKVQFINLFFYRLSIWCYLKKKFCLVYSLLCFPLDFFIFLGFTLGCPFWVTFCIR